MNSFISNLLCYFCYFWCCIFCQCTASVPTDDNTVATLVVADNGAEIMNTVTIEDVGGRNIYICVICVFVGRGKNCMRLCDW